MRCSAGWPVWGAFLVSCYLITYVPWLPPSWGRLLRMGYEVGRRVAVCWHTNPFCDAMKSIKKITSHVTKKHLAEVVLFVGVILRGHGLDRAAIWHDEAISLNLARLPLPEIARLRGYPLWEMILWPLIRLGGEGLVSLRLPALLASIAALAVMWRIMDELDYTDNQRLFACVLASLLPGQFLIAQDARIYALASLLILAAYLFAIQARWLGLTALCGLMFYAHPVLGAYIVGAYLLAIYRHSDQWRAIVLSGLGVIAAHTPRLLMLSRMVSSVTNANGTFEIAPMGWQSLLVAIRQMLWARSLPQWLPGVGLLLLYVVFGLVLTLDVEDRERNLPAALMVSPLLIILAYSVLINNVTHYRTLGLVLIPLALWLAAATAPREWTPLKMVLPLAWCLLILAGLWGWNPARRGAGLDVVAEVVSPDDTVMAVTATGALAPREYLGEVYLLDADQHTMLVSNQLQRAFGLRRAGWEIAPDVVLYPQDELITDDVRASVDAYLAATNARAVGVIPYWQTAPIVVWRVPDQ